MNDTDVFFVLALLFWPDFIVHDDYVVLKGNFSEDEIEELKQQNKNVESSMNFVSMNPYFEGEKDQAIRAEKFSKILIDIWKTKLNRDFPGKQFVVKYIASKENGEIGLTFCQKKFVHLQN